VTITLICYVCLCVAVQTHIQTALTDYTKKYARQNVERVEIIGGRCGSKDCLGEVKLNELLLLEHITCRCFVKYSRYIVLTCKMQGCPQDVKSQDRDETETFNLQDRDETRRSKNVSRPRLHPWQDILKRFLDIVSSRIGLRIV